LIYQNTNKETGLTDSSVKLYPVDGYGNIELVRQLIKIEKPDAIMLITDPRYFMWLFNAENEIRKKYLLCILIFGMIILLLYIIKHFMNHVMLIIRYFKTNSKY
jgi:hypothetical protein